MAIYEDIRSDTLNKRGLATYLKNDPNILNGLDSADGYTPLIAAAVNGKAEIVQLLLKQGARVDAPSRDGETPLLLVARKASYNHARVIQLLLSAKPPPSIDAPDSAGKTPLMFAIQNKDIESIRLLSRAGASQTVTDANGVGVKELAKQTGDVAVLRALNPAEPSILAKVTNVVVTFVLTILAWINGKTGGIIGKLFGFNPKASKLDITNVNKGNRDPTLDQFTQNVDQYVNDNPVLQTFFKNKKDYIKEMARRAAGLAKDSATPLGRKDLLPKTVSVTLHQQVIYCDDSGSMKRDGRWDSQKKLVDRIARIATRILPDGEGVFLRFINQNVTDDSNLTLEMIAGVLDSITAPSGDTPIGTSLKDKILTPLVYSKLESKTLERPLLVSIITDGMPDGEHKTCLEETIAECGVALEKNGYPRGTVRYLIGQIGNAKMATKFLEHLRNNKEISDVVHITTDQLDAKLTDLHENEGDLDQWLVETLFAPIKEYT